MASMGMQRVTEIFSIRYPIVQAGMVWCAGWELASAVSNAGGLGLIGSGSMYPDVLKQHIRKCRAATEKPFGVNVPLIYPDVQKHMQVIVEEKVKIVFTSAGNPKAWTPFLKQRGITVAHVVASAAFAAKSEAAGVDAVVAEGFEAGGHNGREETTTLCLVPLVRRAVKIPVLAAGGISDGRAMLAAMVLGADGVQVGTRFALSRESSGHEAFKQRSVEAGEGGTVLCMKKLMPVRIIKNEFCRRVAEAEECGAASAELQRLLGDRRSKRGMFEGDLEEGELEIGQASAGIHSVEPAAKIVSDMWTEFNHALDELHRFDLHNQPKV